MRSGCMAGQCQAAFGYKCPPHHALPSVCASPFPIGAGTLTVSNIDYKTMRQKTGIPAGDLFTVGGAGSSSVMRLQHTCAAPHLSHG